MWSVWLACFWLPGQVSATCTIEHECSNYGSESHGSQPSCPFANADRAICDVSSSALQNEVLNCRTNVAGNCWGKVKCNTEGVNIGGRLNGTADDGGGEAACASSGLQPGQDCSYVGQTGNWKVCLDSVTSSSSSLIAAAASLTPAVTKRRLAASAASSPRPSAKQQNVTHKPTRVATDKPTKKPSLRPTARSTKFPTSSKPNTSKPSRAPSKRPTVRFGDPDPVDEALFGWPWWWPLMLAGDKRPTLLGTHKPSKLPTVRPTRKPSTGKPTIPTQLKPSSAPSSTPTTDEPTGIPTVSPTARPTQIPTTSPTCVLSEVPSVVPSQRSFGVPTAIPTHAFRCVVVNGLNWCRDIACTSLGCDGFCQRVHGSSGAITDDTQWLNAQNTTAECKQIRNALGLSSPNLFVDDYPDACIEVSEDARTFSCSTNPNCPAAHRTQTDSSDCAVCPCACN